MASRILTMLLVGSLPFTGLPSALAENAMGYRLLSPEEAARLPSNHGSLGMNVERSRQITDSGMTFDIIRISQIRPRSPAARAGFHPDDQIIAVDGRVFPSIAVFGAYIAALAPGSQATVDYVPAGEGPSNAQRVTVALGAAASSSNAAATPATSLTTGQKVAIGVGAAALLGCYEMGCFSPRRTTGQPPARPSPLPGR
jgi:C-terminal processing protease CtpA/Prc